MRDTQTQWIDAMRRGDHLAAWHISDRVLAARDPATRDDPSLPYHRRWVWDGRDPRGRHVLVRCYHGLGDTLQFARYLPALRRIAASLTLEVQPELLGLLAAVPGPDRVVPFMVAAPTPPSECDIEIMELAHALRLAPEAVPPLSLPVPPVRLQGAGIGVCWQAGGWDAARSIPLDRLASALAPALAGRRLLSLQPGVGESEGVAFVNPAGAPAGIAATAGLIAGLELVITVDTMVAHLAGTLGRPTWLLLRHDADWRWMQGRTDTPWYGSMRLFRQAAPGDWQAVARAVGRALMRAG